MPMDPVTEQKIRIAAKKASRRPVNGLAMIGIFFACVLAGLLTLGLLAGLILGVFVISIIHYRNKTGGSVRGNRSGRSRARRR